MNLKFYFKSAALATFACVYLIGCSVTKPALDPSAGVLIRGPYLQAATDNSIVIRWRTEKPTIGMVWLGSSTDNVSKKGSEDAPTTEHIVKVDGLKPETKYFYSIGDKQAALQGNAENYFYTLPEPGKAGVYRVGIFGDCGTNTVKQTDARDQLIKYLGSNYMTAWILLGDNAYNTGTDAQYQTNFFNIYKDNLLKKYPLFPAPGNHDYANLRGKANDPLNSSGSADYYKNFTMPINGESGGVPSKDKAFYSFDIGNAHFLSLDSYGDREGLIYDTLSAEVKWVKEDLAANKNKQWVIAYWHHPPYTMGTHDSDKEQDLVKIRENFIKILERNGVDLIICGHSHTYERSKLMTGYFGRENDFSPKFNLSNSTGTYTGADNSCPYVKSSVVNQGTVYVVTGSAGKIGGAQPTWPHNAMTFSNNTITGASMLEIQGNRIDLKWLSADGKIGDQFTMMKDVNQTTNLAVKKGKQLTLTASYVGNYNWAGSSETAKTITVKPTETTTYTVRDQFNCIQDTFNVTVED
ncbi:MAG: metallophosphoesterase [Sphingobacteriaceae bacterium]|jgi:3',5'-cyclic AMP phosphodiesterase CpdA|nr:metallophosphoesterase [Sphingobacteriaceae bacterium]